MKGKKPSYSERKLLQENGLDTYTWLIQKNTPTLMQVVNRETGEEKRIQK